MYKKKKDALLKKTDKPKTLPSKTTNDLSAAKKPTYKQTKEFEALEIEIDQLETEKKLLLEKMNRGEGSPEDFTTYGIRYAEIESLLETKTERWMELAELFEE